MAKRAPVWRNTTLYFRNPLIGCRVRFSSCCKEFGSSELCTAMFSPSNRLHIQKAFSLVEMLMVIVIIGILVGSVAMLTIPRPTPNQAGTLASAAMEQARMGAIASGKSTALLFLSDPAHEEGFGKMQIVRRSGEDETDGVPLWEAVGTPIELGSGIFLKESECTSDSSGSVVARMQMPWGGGREGEGVEWIAYQFGGDGVPLQPSGRIVFGRGRDGDFIRSQEDAAFILSRNGRPTPVFDFTGLEE